MTSTRPVDTLKTAVYRVEDSVIAAMDAGRDIKFYNEILTPGRDIKYEQPRDARFLVNMVWAAEFGPRPPAPTVRKRRGVTKAHYSLQSHDIALPETEWAMRASVVLHELAHAVTWKRYGRYVAAHGPEFAKTYAALVSKYLDPVAGLLLLDGFRMEGLLGGVDEMK